jgi:hypothetical protein
MSESMSPSICSAATGFFFSVDDVPARPLSVVPSARLTMPDGILTLRSVPPGANAALPSLLAMITPIAPAFCAFSTLTVKLQVPRSTIAILPVSATVAPRSRRR